MSEFFSRGFPAVLFSSQLNRSSGPMLDHPLSFGAESDRGSDVPFAELEKAWASAWSKFAGSPTALKLRSASVAISERSPTDIQLIERLRGEQLEAWEKLRKVAHPTRLGEWLTARAVENEVREELGPGSLHSLSHTAVSGQNFVLVVGANSLPGAPLQGVGVDLEASTRAISPKVAERLLGQSERHWVESGKLEALDIWVLKEAAFKATPSNAGAVLSDYELSQWDPVREEGALKSRLLASQNLTCRVRRVNAHVAGLGLKAAFAITANAEGLTLGHL